MCFLHNCTPVFSVPVVIFNRFIGHIIIALIQPVQFWGRYSSVSDSFSFKWKSIVFFANSILYIRDFSYPIVFRTSTYHLFTYTPRHCYTIYPIIDVDELKCTDEKIQKLWRSIITISPMFDESTHNKTYLHFIRLLWWGFKLF